MIQLRGRRVVIKADVPSERIGSVAIPERYRDQPLTGTIAAVGHAVTEVAVGERVMFGAHAWSRFNAPGYGFPYVLLKEEDLLCVITS